jgi:hypothetical protein
MKTIKITVSALLIVCSIGCVKAQELNEELKQGYEKFNSPVIANKVVAVVQLDQIATKWDKQWAANYYAAYANAAIAAYLHDAARQDVYLDKADQYLSRVVSLNNAADETYVLAAFVAYSRFMIDPSNRWKKYMPIMNDNLEKAKKINPANPRIYYLQGIPVFHKPKLFGGGKNKAKPYFEKAKTLFAKQDASAIQKPYWGEKENADYLAKCNE